MNISMKVIAKDKRTTDLENKAKRKSIIENGLAKKGKDRKWLSEQTGISLFNLNAYIDGMINLDERQTKKIMSSIGIENFMQEAVKEFPMPSKSVIRPVTREEVQKDTSKENADDHNEKSESKSTVFLVNGPAQRYKNVGEMIKYYAMKKHLSPADMSKKLGCSKSEFEEWENDISLPNQQTFLDILKILQIKEMQYGDLERASDEEQKKIEEEGAKLRRLRAEKSISINDLANDIHGTRFEIQCYENGYVKPDSETYQEIMNVLNTKHDPKQSSKRSSAVHLTKYPRTSAESRMAEAFGKRLKAERMKRRLKTADVYEKTSLTSKQGWSYKRVESGRTLPTKYLVDEIAAALGCEESVLTKGIAGLEEFLDGTEVQGSNSRGDRQAENATATTKDVSKGEMDMGNNSQLKLIAERFGMTEEEFVRGMKDMNLAITDQRTGKTWTMAPSREELILKINGLSRAGRIKAGKALEEIAKDPENIED